jgi:putative FmdB family regulatory protein
MPTYDYLCDSCGHEFESFESITADPRRDCPECKQPSLRRKIGPGAAILFKGSGFYQTDYRSESYKKAAKAESPATDSKAAPSDGGGSKGDTAKAATPSPASKPDP